MQLTVTFNSMEEVKEFITKNILIGSASENTPAPVQAAPVQATPVQTAPVQTAPVQAAPVQVQAAPVQVQAAPAPVQTTAPAYTLDDLSRAAMQIMDAGRQADLLQLLGQFGVPALPALPKEAYGSFATALRGLGARI